MEGIRTGSPKYAAQGGLPGERTKVLRSQSVVRIALFQGEGSAESGNEDRPQRGGDPEEHPSHQPAPERQLLSQGQNLNPQEQ